MSINDFNSKAMFIVSNTAQIEMFKRIIEDIKDFEIKFINTEVFSILDEMDSLLNKYGFDYENIDNWSMDLIHNILGNDHPNIIISAHDQSPVDILFIKAANELGLPSLTVQEGLLAVTRFVNKSVSDKLVYMIKMSLRMLKLILNPYRPFKYKTSRLKFELEYGRGYSYAYGHGDSSKIALFGDNTKNMLVSEGVPPEKLVVTGNSKFDNLFPFKDPIKKKGFREKYNVPLDKKVVLVLTQWFVESGVWSAEQRKIFVGEIVKACIDLSDVQLCFKLHAPHESEADYREILEDLPLSPLIYTTEPIHEIICMSDVVVSVSSTAALESLALDKPVLIINLFDDEGALLFKDGGVLYVEKADMIQSALKKLVYHPMENVDWDKMEKFVRDEAYIIDGNASKRISTLIRKMALKEI